MQYRAGTSAPWSDGSHIGTALTAILTGLLEDTSYQVQVRATNAEGTGGWSASGSGATDANAAPAFTSSTTFNPAENQTAVGTVEAEDSDTADDITGYALSGGADQALFSINNSGVLTFLTAPNYEDPQDANTDNAYVVVVQATSGTGDREQTGTQTITVTVMDDDTEAPGAPDAPSVSPASVTSLTVTWSAPDNAGPEITDYDVQYRAGTSAPWSDGSHIGTALTAILTGLLEDTSYQVQVRATNAEGTGGWSASGSGATDANAAPSFTSAATFNPAENQTAVGTVRASDSDTDDEHHRLRAQRRRGPGAVLHQQLRRADVPDGAQLRGPAGREHRQRLSGGGAGDQRHGRPGADGDPDHHGDGDGRRHRGAGRAGCAVGVAGVGDEPDGDLVGAGQRRPGDHGLRRAVPGGHERAVE